MPCKQCPENNICFGGNLVAASPGYFRHSSQAEYSMPCYNSEACVGGTREQPLGECAEGYKGLACSKCLNNYFK